MTEATSTTAASVPTLEDEIFSIIKSQVAALNRPERYREPLVAFSQADDPRYRALKDIIGPWHKTPQEFLPQAISVISYFVPFTRELVAEPQHTRHASQLWAEAYLEINQHFDIINNALIEHLESKGHTAIQIPATHTYDPANMHATWSHKSAAVISGLAAFGANKLAITRKGSGGRFSTVITSASLKNSKEPVEDLCLYHQNGRCGLCFDVCPVHALTPDGLDKFACQDELFKNQSLLEANTTLMGADVCGKCISVCPVAYLD
ncbi:MAG: 4Fe-4S double cluster binding domain-containing protein [Atopobiaceae bacterium]|jgi:epoxyqueuosine reductase